MNLHPLESLRIISSLLFILFLAMFSKDLSIQSLWWNELVFTQENTNLQ